MPDIVDTDAVRDHVRAIIHAEFLRIGIYVDDEDIETLRRTRANFEWLDQQRRNAEEGRAEFRRALIHRSAEWLWHIVSAAIAGTITYVFTTRGHS
jgi:hypothetical protein